VVFAPPGAEFSGCFALAGILSEDVSKNQFGDSCRVVLAIASHPFIGRIQSFFWTVEVCPAIID